MFDKRVDEMLGYTCFSPDDTGDIKKFIRELLEEIKDTQELNRYLGHP